MYGPREMAGVHVDSGWERESKVKVTETERERKRERERVKERDLTQQRSQMTVA